MNTPSTDLFGLAERKLGWLEERQRVLARNIANSDTPNYQSRDLQSFDSTLSRLAVDPVQTNPMHISGGRADPGVIVVQSGDRAPDGNAVSVESEMGKVADTDSQQRFVANLYTKYMSMFAIALGKA